MGAVTGSEGSESFEKQKSAACINAVHEPARNFVV